MKVAEYGNCKKFLEQSKLIIKVEQKLYKHIYKPFSNPCGKI